MMTQRKHFCLRSVRLWHYFGVAKSARFDRSEHLFLDICSVFFIDYLPAARLLCLDTIGEVFP